MFLTGIYFLICHLCDFQVFSKVSNTVGHIKHDFLTSQKWDLFWNKYVELRVVGELNYFYNFVNNFVTNHMDMSVVCLEFLKLPEWDLLVG